MSRMGNEEIKQQEREISSGDFRCLYCGEVTGALITTCQDCAELPEVKAELATLKSNEPVEADDLPF